MLIDSEKEEMSNNLGPSENVVISILISFLSKVVLETFSICDVWNSFASLSSYWELCPSTMYNCTYTIIYIQDGL